MRPSKNVTVSSAQRLDRAVQALTGLSRAGVRGLLDHDRVRVNGSITRLGQTMLKIDDAVEITHDPHTRLREKPRIKADPAYEILFEDEHLLVVNKAAHVLTVPTESGKGKTLIDALQRYVDRQPGASRRGGQAPALHVVHRLDQGVSGVMLVAKTSFAAARIKDQFADYKPQRIYLAIVNGDLAQKSGTFRSHLATDSSLNRYSTRTPGEGELAVTHYEVVAHARGATVVRVKLETGRRNQIRVHFAEAGHPVLGDPRYPRNGGIAPPPQRRGAKTQAAAVLSSAHPKWKARRIALHARSLQFEHPETGEKLRFEATVPLEFAPFMPGRARR